MKEYLPIITDTDRETVLGLIERYKTLIWTDRYYTPGDFEIVCPLEYLDLLAIDRYIDVDGFQGVIEKIVIQTDAESGATITASGRTLNSILGRRVVTMQTEFNSTLSHAVDRLVRYNFIDVYRPALGSAREVPGLLVGDVSVGDDIDYSAQYTGDNVLEAVQNLCEEHGLGFRLTRCRHTSYSGVALVFDLYAGTDHSFGQTENEVYVFSEELENLSALTYAEDHSTTINEVIVMGEGEGYNRARVWAGDDGTTHSGLARYEGYCDARDLSKTSESGTISDEDYYAQLSSRGEAMLTTFDSVFTSSGDVGRYPDIAVGDLVGIVSNKTGLKTNARLVELIHSVSETGAYHVYPTFGS